MAVLSSHFALPGKQPSAGRRRGHLLATVAAGIGLVLATPAAEGDPTKPRSNAFFEANIGPLLAKHCYECHSRVKGKSKGGLQLDSAAALLTGGANGPAIIPGNPEASRLIKAVHYTDPDLQMPPKRKLAAEEIAALEQWIKMGAPAPDAFAGAASATAIDLEKRKQQWAFQPLQRPPLPQVKDARWIRSPLDRFILARLEQQRLKPSPPADRRLLLRRLTFDLHGLPPTPEETQAFLADQDPQAYEKLVDRLLDSPRYGERWARHWLDIAHYADTHGFERDQLRPNAWRYRDYVIRALNADKPYDQFLREQIAGDVLRPDDPEAVAATGFLAAGPWDFVGQAETQSEVLKRAARADDLDDMVTQVMTAACATTINCARCHDHKLDPISQREYYSLAAVFSGVKRGEINVHPARVRELEAHRLSLSTELQQSRTAIARLGGAHYDLADIVGGGGGLGSGKVGEGIDPLTGKGQTAKRGFLEGAKPNTYARSAVRFVDGVVVPDASREGTIISSTGLRIKDVPKTSGQAWDAIRLGPVNSQFATTLGGVDFGAEGHTLLALHANAAITFDLAELRKAGAPAELNFTASVGYFGQTPKDGASLAVYVDGDRRAQHTGIGRDDGIIPVAVQLPASARFLTLMATDNGNGIGHDQICFADPWLIIPSPVKQTEKELAELGRLKMHVTALEQELKALPAPEKIYAVLSEAPAAMRVLRRGDPEQPGEEVAPATIGCVVGLKPELAGPQSAEGDRRRALAAWITHPANPLTSRVMVNRLWHYHFGTGLVDTPSDFGAGGGRPSHPELLDWLASEFAARSWSLKAMHRLICTSATYRQVSSSGIGVTGPASGRATQNPKPEPRHLDSGNRLLWRQNPRRIEAEALRDAVLVVSGKLNPAMFGPGYRDFDYQEEYAPVYKYITPDAPELWRRSVYRFVVRTTTHQFLTTLDCANPANLTPTRNVTTTALQSLALLNNDFMLQQAGYFAERVRSEAGDQPAAQVHRAFALAFARKPSVAEHAAATELAQARGLAQLCRMLLNTNEFVYVD